MSPTKKGQDSTISRRPQEELAESVIIREIEKGTRCENCMSKCPGYVSHDWRKTCQSCKCPREAHAIYQEQVASVRERLGFKVKSPTISDVDPKDSGYTWVPPGIMASSKIQRYFDKIPPNKVPKIGTEGEKYREKQIVLQLPKQDLALKFCQSITPEQSASYEDFIAARNEIALDIGYIKDANQNTNCVHCDESIPKGDMAVIAPKFIDDMMWHPKCFTCNTCNELLVDLTYCVYEDKIYCERHYAECLRARCNACDEAAGQPSIPKKDSENVSIVVTTTSAAPLPSNAFANETEEPSNTFPGQSEDHYDSSHAGGQSEEILRNRSHTPSDKLSREAEDELIEKLTYLEQEYDVRQRTSSFLEEERNMKMLSVPEEKRLNTSPNHPFEESEVSELPNAPIIPEVDVNSKELNLPREEKQEIVSDLELERRTRMLEDEHLSQVSKNVLTPKISVQKAPEEEVPKILEIRVLKVQIVESNPRTSLLPEGVSSFYDFNASVSREVTPEPTMDIKTYNIEENNAISRESSVGRGQSSEPFLNISRSSREPSEERDSEPNKLAVSGSNREPSVEREISPSSLDVPRSFRERSVEREIVPESDNHPRHVEQLTIENEIEQSNHFLNIARLSREPSRERTPEPSASKNLTLEMKPEPKAAYQRRLLEDISPFYDFNASVNPWFFKRQSISENKPSKEDLEDGLQYKGQRRRKISIKTIRKQIHQLDTKLEEGISDFFDFNVNISKSTSTSPEYSTSRSNSKDRDLPAILLPSSEDVRYDGPKCNTADTRHLTMAMIDGDFQRADPFRQKSPSPKCYSADNTFLTMEILDRNFKRSTYVGESSEFADHLDYRREFTKTFRRSESKSPSPLNKIETNTRMLDEEFKGAINFPYDYDRRASDTALLQKNEILFQIQDIDTISEGFERDEDYLNALEEDEYHHFRRFSLNQDFTREGSADSNYFIQEIEIRTLSGEKVSTWVNSSPFECSPLDTTPSPQDSMFDKSDEISTSMSGLRQNEEGQHFSDYSNREQIDEFSKDAVDNFLQSLDENDYTGSEDERQTVYESQDFVRQRLDEEDFKLIEDTAAALDSADVEYLKEEQKLAIENLIAAEKYHTESTMVIPTPVTLCRDHEVAGHEIIRAPSEALDIKVENIEDVIESAEKQKELSQINEDKDESLVDTDSSTLQTQTSTSEPEESIEIEEIYEDAIKDRKQSGILREFDSLIGERDVEERNIPEPLEVPQLNAIEELHQNDEHELTESEDERLTVVEVDDGIVSDDRNDESFTEQSHSECEQAEREAGHQWIEDVAIALQPAIPNDIGLQTTDDDSAQIEEIYVEAIRNRKQSGILRDYDSLAVDDVYSANEDLLQEILGQEYKTVFKRSSSVTSEGSYYGPTDRKDRYLGDANADARNSVRQRARYGVTQKFESLEEDFEVDMSYVPKKEYNWRKNFKIEDDDEVKEKTTDISNVEVILTPEPVEEVRSPSVLSESGAVKKKKSKKKIRKSSKSSLDDDYQSFSPKDIEDDDDYVVGEHYKSPSVENRRSKSRFSLEELESRRSSINLGEEISKNVEEEVIEKEIKLKKVKKIKRKKSKGDIKEENLGTIEQSYLNGEISYETLIEFGGQDIQERRDSKSRTIKKRKKSKGSFSPLIEELKEVKQDGADIFERHVENDLIAQDITKEAESVREKLDSVEVSTQNLNESVVVEQAAAEVEVGVDKKEEIPKTSKLQKAQADSFDFVKDSGFYPLF